MKTSQLFEDDTEQSEMVRMCNIRNYQLRHDVCCTVSDIPNHITRDQFRKLLQLSFPKLVEMKDIQLWEKTDYTMMGKVEGVWQDIRVSLFLVDVNWDNDSYSDDLGIMKWPEFVTIATERCFSDDDELA